jgi:hypothetical protein
MVSEKRPTALSSNISTFAVGNERNWAKLLALAEFAYNASKHKATEKTLFEVELGYVPRMPLDIIAATTSVNVNAREDLEDNEK